MSGSINVTPSFVLAGESTFTVSNGVGRHHTFHVYKSEPRKGFTQPSWFIKILTGPDNTLSEDYTYIGMLEGGIVNQWDHAPRIKLTSKSAYREEAEPVKIARWAIKVIWQATDGRYRLPPGYSIKHMGRCGRCGRPLTHPASLDTGIGPDCAAEMGIEWAERPGALFG
jgi:hypothetical protein